MSEPDQKPFGQNPDQDLAQGARAPEEAVLMPSTDEAAGENSGAARVAALEGELTELKDRLLRAHAELENQRRRAEREREDTQKYAITKFARDLLSVADNLRRALEAVPAAEDENLRNFIAGVEVTERELMTVFERYQVRPIEALGQRFDANFHEAVFEAEDPGQPAGTIMQVMAPGYTLAGRLLRAAMVGVTRGGPREGKMAQNLDTSA